MKLTIKKGTTSKILHIFITDSSKSDGSGLTGLAYNSSGLAAYYVRPGDAVRSEIVLAQISTLGTYVSCGFKEFSAIYMPGVYELHPPNVCLASGADSVVIFLKGAANMAPLPIEIQLDDNTAKDIYDRIGAPAGASVAADLVTIDNVVDVIEARLTAARAGYLDNLSAGAVALASTALTNVTWTAAKAGFIDVAISGRAPANEYDVQMGYIPSNLGDVPTDSELDASHGAGSWESAVPPTVGAIADAVWDEILTGATHNIATSAGRRVREIGAYAIASGTAQGGNGHSITLAASDTAGDNIYNRNLIVITDNTGVGQTRTIVGYDGTSKVAVVDRDWYVQPDATTEYQITPDDTPLVVDHGIARDGTSTTIQLRTSASAIDDTYHGAIVTILAGTGAGQSKLVDTYDGTTKTATICKTWETTPDTTSVYVLMPYGVSEVCCICDEALDAISDGVWDELQAGHVAAGTFGETATEIADIKARTDKMRVYGIDQ